MIDFLRNEFRRAASTGTGSTAFAGYDPETGKNGVWLTNLKINAKQLETL